MILRVYQQEQEDEVLSQDGNILIQSDTGSGKTRVLASITKKHDHVICIAHRNILAK